MKAVLTIGHRHFAFKNVAKAAAVMQALSEAVAVRRKYESGDGLVYLPEEDKIELSLSGIEDAAFILPGRVPRERRLGAPSEVRP